ILISGTVFIIYTILGGQLSIIKTDCIQLIFIVLGIVLCYLFLPSFNLNYVPPAFFNEKFGKLDLIVLILTYSTTFLVGPDIYSRIFCSKNIGVAKKSIVISVAILIPLAFILTRIGIYSAGAYPELASGQSPLLYVAANTLPKPISLVLYFGLLSALISSADTCLLTSASVFTQIFTNNLEKEKSIKLTRIFIAVFGIFSILVSLKLKFILSSLLLALSVYSGAVIIPALAGIMGYRFKKAFVLAAIISGGSTALLGKIYGGSNANYILILAFVINLAILMVGKVSKDK
ncbi:MAG: sodium:solute symporter family protein, partial [Fusobacteriaceae bacterium]